jgi:hypothetical protein
MEAFVLSSSKLVLSSANITQTPLFPRRILHSPGYPALSVAARMDFYAYSRGYQIAKAKKSRAGFPCVRGKNGDKARSGM